MGFRSGAVRRRQRRHGVVRDSDRGARAVDSSVVRSQRTLARDDADPPLRIEEQRERWLQTSRRAAGSPPSASPRQCRLRCQRHASFSVAARRRVDRERLEALHHERRNGRHVGITLTARTSDDEISNIVVRTARLDSSCRRQCEARLACLRHTRALVQGLLRPRGRPVRSARRRLPAALDILDGGRIFVAAMSMGSRRARRPRLSYAEARQFGKPITSFQAIRFKLADMATRSSRRALVLKAAWLKDQGRPFAREAAMAKLYTGELSNRVANAALQIHGGFGDMEEAAVSRFYRDQKILEIGEGTMRCSGWSSLAISVLARCSSPVPRRACHRLACVPIERELRVDLVRGAERARRSDDRVAVTAPPGLALEHAHPLKAGLGPSREPRPRGRADRSPRQRLRPSG